VADAMVRDGLALHAQATTGWENYIADAQFLTGLDDAGILDV